MTQLKNKISSRRSIKGYKYRKYPLARRMRLVEMVQKENQSLAFSAKTLEIAQTTARLIMKTWKTEGRYFQKKTDRLKREKKEAAKAYQLRRKEKQRLKKLSRQVRIERNQEEEPEQKLVKIEGNQLEAIKECDMVQTNGSDQEIAPLTNPWMYLAPVYLFYSQNVFF